MDLGTAARVWPVLRQLLDSSAEILRQQPCNFAAPPAECVLRVDPASFKIVQKFYS